MRRGPQGDNDHRRPLLVEKAFRSREKGFRSRVGDRDTTRVRGRGGAAAPAAAKG